MSRTEPLLEVDDLHVRFDTRHGTVDAVDGISFAVGRGERVAIVGESGSGKSMTGRAAMRLVRPPGRVEAKALRFDGTDLATLPEREMRDMRGRRIAMIMQDPKFSLNPVMRIGRQLREVQAVHGRVGRGEAKRRSLAMLADVAISDPERVLASYPHELSGGMGQRVMIAMMLLLSPELLIADEPTSALDVTVQLEVLRILDDLVEKRGMGLVFISHDLRLVASFCDRVLVMFRGRIVEEIAAKNLAEARHPYTQGLLACLPRVGDGGRELTTLKRDAAWASA